MIGLRSYGIRTEPKSLPRFVQGIFILTSQNIIHTKIVVRDVIVWIALGPGPQYLDRLIAIPGHIRCIFLRNVITLALADAIPKIIGLLRILLRQLRLKHIVISHCQSGVRHAKVWIEFNRPLIESNRFGLLSLRPLLGPLSEGLKRLE